MGYGSRALALLKQYYKGQIPSLSETSVATADLELSSSSAELV